MQKSVRCLQSRFTIVSSVFVLAISFALVPDASHAQDENIATDIYFRVNKFDLKITEGDIPPTPTFNYLTRQRALAMLPRVVLDGPGEAFVGDSVGLTMASSNSLTRTEHDKTGIAFRVPSNNKVTGTLYLPKKDWSGMAAVKFEVNPLEARSKTARDFHNTRLAHIERLGQYEAAGGAWWRYLESESHKHSGQSAVRRRGSRWRQQSLMSFGSGSRALAENLALDRLPRVNGNNTDQVVDVSTIKGIEIAEMDWKPLLGDADPKLDALSSSIPFDQHAIYFENFGKLVQVVDEFNENGTILDAFSSRIEQDRTLAKYETQLCLKLDTAARAFGGALAKSIAITGSDLDLSLGSDVAILFESPSPKLLLTAITTQQKAIIATNKNCNADDGKFGEVSFFGAKSPDRSISSYVADLGGTIVVSNSQAQLRRIVSAHDNTIPAMADLDEFKFFRHRYSLDNKNETVFVMLTDAAIRRWCGPKWRIAAARRARVAAILSQETALAMQPLVSKTVTPKTIQAPWSVAGLDVISVTNSGCASAAYGDLKFMTPIIELDMNKVTTAESNAYKSWRKDYGKSWRKFFDPIGISLEIKKHKLALDISVLPLIAESAYRDLVEFTKGIQLKPNSGDRHSGSMLDGTWAVNPKSKQLAGISNLLTYGGYPKGNAKNSNDWDWVGNSVSIVFEHDRFWNDLYEVYKSGQDRFAQDYLFRNLGKLPIYIRMDVSDQKKAIVFEDKLHQMMKGFLSAYLGGGETVIHEGVEYIRYSTTQKGKEAYRMFLSPKKKDQEIDIGLSFGLTGRSFIITTNDKLMRAAIERDQKRSRAVADGKPLKEFGKPWLGESFGVQADMRLMDTVGLMFGELSQMQARSWANIPILNEWKRRFPKQDSLEVQKTIWNQIVRCPGGGEYVWNEEFHTYESTVYGHPADPHEGPSLPPQLRKVERVNYGITFENDGLRSRVQISRSLF